MKTSIGLGFGFVWLALSAEPSAAASMQYCNLYAREYVEIVGPKLLSEPDEGTDEERLLRLQNQAYAKCLNQDDEPQLPAASSAGDEGAAATAETEVVGEGDADPGDEVVVEEPPAAKPVHRKTKVAGKYRGSGLKAWTPEWVAWCKAHYRSFDAKTGYVRPHSGAPMLCP